MKRANSFQLAIEPSKKKIEKKSVGVNEALFNTPYIMGTLHTL